MQFQDRYIYQLPNGREVFAETRDDKQILVNVSSSHDAEYEPDKSGRLWVSGQLTDWTVDDLIETGRVASPELAKNMLESTDREVSAEYENNLNQS